MSKLRRYLSIRPAPAGVTILMLSLICGCEKPKAGFGWVDGTVTMDGEPLPEALVTFEPDDGPRISAGRTDAKGRYSLRFSRTIRGASVGEHRVVISTRQAAWSDGETRHEARPEVVPIKYNIRSTLVAMVEPGKNEINFDLDSQGEIASDPSDYVPPVLSNEQVAALEALQKALPLRPPLTWLPSGL